MTVKVWDIKWDNDDISLPKEVYLKIRDDIDEEVDETEEEVIEAILFKKFKHRVLDFYYSEK